MKEELLELLRAVPFVPFVIEVADDVVYAIATVDHVLPAKHVLAILDDEENVDILAYDHIRRLRFRGVSV